MTPIVVPDRVFERCRYSSATSSISRYPVPSPRRVPPTVRFSNGSYTLPTQFVTTIAPTVHGPTRAALLPSPPFVPPVDPNNGPTVAPIPAPTFPCATVLADAAVQAAYPRSV